MAFPPQHISVKRRRDEDPVSMLYIQTDSPSAPLPESKRRRSEFVFKRVLEGSHTEKDTLKSGGAIGGKEATSTTKMATSRRYRDGIRRTATGVPIVIALGEDGQEQEGAQRREQLQGLAAMRPAAPAGDREKKMDGHTVCLPTTTATTTATDVAPEEDNMGLSGGANSISTSTTAPAARVLTAEEESKAIETGVATLSLSKKRNKSRSLSPTEIRAVKKIRTFRLEQPKKDSSGPAFSGVKKTRKSKGLAAVFVEEKPKTRDADTMGTETEEPLRDNADKGSAGDPMSVDPQAPATLLPAQPRRQTSDQKKPNRDKDEAARRAIRIASSPFGAGKLKYQPKPPPPRPQRLSATNGIQSGTQQIQNQLPVPIDEQTIVTELEAFTLEVLAESNNTPAPTLPLALPPTLPPLIPPRRKPRASSLSSTSDDEYVIDRYVRVRASSPFSPSSHPSDTEHNVGILRIPREDEEHLSEWFVPEPGSSSDEQRDECEEDSNAEDAAGNDYPEEEESDDDDDDDGAGDEDDVWGEYEHQPARAKRWMRPAKGYDSDDEDEDGEGDEEMGEAEGFQEGEDWRWDGR